jgi:hypothetical protein
MTYTPKNATGVSGSEKVCFPAYTMLALTLIGIGIAVYVAQGNYSGDPLWCPIIDGCNAVVNSPSAAGAMDRAASGRPPAAILVGV